MKTNSKFALAALTAVLFATGSALADDSGWYTIDNHHGRITYIRRPVTETQKQPTVGFFGHSKGVGHKNNEIKRTETKPAEHNVGLREISTPHGTVSYFAPAV
jgi:hypothetical protein